MGYHFVVACGLCASAHAGMIRHGWKRYTTTRCWRDGVGWSARWRIGYFCSAPGRGGQRADSDYDHGRRSVRPSRMAARGSVRFSTVGAARRHRAHAGEFDRKRRSSARSRRRSSGEEVSCGLNCGGGRGLAPKASGDLRQVDLRRATISKRGLPSPAGGGKPSRNAGRSEADSNPRYRRDRACRDLHRRLARSLAGKGQCPHAVRMAVSVSRRRRGTGAR